MQLAVFVVKATLHAVIFLILEQPKRTLNKNFSFFSYDKPKCKLYCILLESGQLFDDRFSRGRCISSVMCTLLTNFYISSTFASGILSSFIYNEFNLEFGKNLSGCQNPISGYWSEKQSPIWYG